MRNEISLVVLLLIILCIPVSGEGEKEAPKNLLKNSSFQQATNPGLPDYWHGQSGWRQGTHTIVGESHTKGTKSMLLDNHDGKPVRLISHNFGWSPGKAGTVYTFSAYLKSEEGNLKVKFGSKTLEWKELEVGPSWKRYVITAPLKAAKGFGARFLYVEITLTKDTKGRLYVNSPMLVRGEKPGEYKLIKVKEDDNNAPSLTDALIGEWIFNNDAQKDQEGKVLIKDTSKNHNDGLVYGNASWASGKFGSALYFDGKTYVLIDYDDSIKGRKDELTIEMVLRPESGENTGILIRGMQAGGYALHISRGRYGFILSSWKFGPSWPVIMGWDHIVCTFKKSKVKVFVNDQCVGTNEIETEITPEAKGRPLVIGGWDKWEKEVGYHPVPGFKGWIRLVRIYDRCLVPEQISSMYANLQKGGG